MNGMTRSFARAALVAVVALPLMACQSQDEARLERSLSDWRQITRTQGDTYSYAVSSSSWTGYETRTALQIESGAVTFRQFESSTRGDDGTQTPLAVQWEERGAEVGTHMAAAAAATVDMLYQRCASEVLTVDPGRNAITLWFDERNVLQTCTYVPKNCADDCTFGVWINELEMGRKY
jgi:hypothetical protein